MAASVGSFSPRLSVPPSRVASLAVGRGRTVERAIGREIFDQTVVFRYLFCLVLNCKGLVSMGIHWKNYRG